MAALRKEVANEQSVVAEQAEQIKKLQRAAGAVTTKETKMLSDLEVSLARASDPRPSPSLTISRFPPPLVCQDARHSELTVRNKVSALQEQVTALKKSETELAEGLNTLGAALNAKDASIQALTTELSVRGTDPPPAASNSPCSHSHSHSPPQQEVKKSHQEAGEGLTMKSAVVSELQTKLSASQSRHKTLQALLWRQEKVQATMKEHEKLLEEQLQESRDAATTLTTNVRELTKRVREAQASEARLEEEVQSATPPDITHHRPDTHHNPFVPPASAPRCNHQAGECAGAAAGGQ